MITNYLTAVLENAVIKQALIEAFLYGIHANLLNVSIMISALALQADVCSHMLAVPVVNINK